MNNTLFIHSKTEPKVTVALVIEGQTANFGLSRCARNDQFSKKKGRLIAEGRAKKNPYAKGTVPHENFAQWFQLHANQMIQEVQNDARLLNHENN